MCCRETGLYFKVSTMESLSLSLFLSLSLCLSLSLFLSLSLSLSLFLPLSLSLLWEGRMVFLHKRLFDSARKYVFHPDVIPPMTRYPLTLTPVANTQQFQLK